MKAAKGGTRILFTGGGTGGHLFPAIAIATALRQNLDDCRILFVGTEKSVNADNLRRYDIPAVALHCSGLKGMAITRTIASLFSLPGAFFRALSIVRSFSPSLAIGVGGYVSGPVLVAAWLCAVPVCIHEQNILPGLANRLLGMIARRIFLSYADTRQLFDPDKIIVTGNPVRSELAIARRGPAPGHRLLVLGGSQGARPINHLMAAAAPFLVGKGDDGAAGLTIVHQTGSHDREELEKAYAAAGIPARLTPFITDMRQAYSEASLVLSRAGATTLAELCLLEKPALLVPFPYAADNHQEKNALLLAADGAALCLPEKDLDGPSLASQLLRLLGNRPLLEEMARAMGRHARPGAAQTITAECLALLTRATGGETPRPPRHATPKERKA